MLLRQRYCHCQRYDLYYSIKYYGLLLLHNSFIGFNRRAVTIYNCRKFTAHVGAVYGPHRGTFSLREARSLPPTVRLMTYAHINFLVSRETLIDVFTIFQFLNFRFNT